MTNIFEYQKANKKEHLRQLQNTKQDNEKRFLDSIKDIADISNLPWYIKIRNFWIYEWNNALQELRDVDLNDIAKTAKIQAKLDLSVKFITYLDGFEQHIK